MVIGRRGANKEKNQRQQDKEKSRREGGERKVAENRAKWHTHTYMKIHRAETQFFAC